jgi:16S rRNA (cytosine1402-N4)-methyltransferase
VWPGHSRSHPATRLFQAVQNRGERRVRTAGAKLCQQWLSYLAPNGRLGIITFHSLEDRIVKQFFKSMAGDRYDAELIEITRQPRTATPNELVINPRSRSAKLRVVAKIKTNPVVDLSSSP